MLIQTSKNENRRRVHDRIRKKVMGTATRPRLNVYRSLNHIYVQVIDDLKGETLVSLIVPRARKKVASAAEIWHRRKPSERLSPSAPRPRALPKWFLIAADTSITA